VRTTTTSGFSDDTLVELLNCCNKNCFILYHFYHLFYFYNINKFSTMPRVFIIAAHGSMPMIADDSVALPKTPEFLNLRKKTAAVGRKTVAPVIKKSTDKKATNKKSTNKKSTNKKSETDSASDSVDPFATPIHLPPSPPPPPPPPVGFVFAAMGAFKKPASFIAPVDTFTTAKCGQPFCADLRCDEPFVGLAYTLSQQRLTSDVPKDAVRKLIQDAMTGIRSDPRHADALTMGENKIRCHIKGHEIADLFLFGPNHAVPVIESVSMVDMATGEIRDVHSRFGLVEKQSVSSTRQAVAHGAADDMAVLQAAKSRAEYDLQTLQHADPFYFKTKQAHIKAIDDTMHGMLHESKFEFSPELKKMYGERVKLSDLLKIGTDTGVIDPENDFVVVYACRVPDERVPPGTMHSPRGSDSEGSVGGTRSNQKQKQKQQSKSKSKSKQRSRRKTCKRRRN